MSANFESPKEKLVLDVIAGHLGDKIADATLLLREIRAYQGAPDELLSDCTEQVDGLVERSARITGMVLQDIERETKRDATRAWRKFRSP